VGRCKTFDASADGYGRAEGAAAAVLAPLGDATTAFALLSGSAVNQDGRSGTLTAPNGPSQSALVSKALR
jgi:acyl transferase domain-containing protein